MQATGAARTRAALGLSLLIGVALAMAASLALFPALGSPWAFITFGAVAGLPVVAMLTPRIGARRAFVLSAVTGVSVGLAFLVIGFAAYIATGLVG